MMEMLSMPFIQRALIAGILVGFICGYYGVFIVQRKMSFLGDGLAHAAFGGVALGVLLGLQPLWIAIPFTILASLAIIWLREKTQLGVDTTIGVLFAVSMALGIIFLFLKKGYTNDALAYLFGSILSVTVLDLIVCGALFLISIMTFFRLWSRWAYSTFDPELAKSDRLPVVKDDYMLVILTAVTIVVTIKIVGMVLMAAFLVIPAASSRLFSKTFLFMTISSIVIGVGSAIIGLLASILLDLPSGATIILTQAALFFVGLVVSKII